MNSYSPISDWRIYREWFYLLVTSTLGMIYFPFLITAYALILPLCLVIVGFPLLKLLHASLPYVAAFDQTLSAIMVGGLDANDFADDLTERVERLNGPQSAGYLFARFPAAIVAVIAASFLLPFLVGEALLNEMGLRTGMISAQIQHLIAAGLAGINPRTIPFRIPSQAQTRREVTLDKPKNDFAARRLENNLAALDDVDTVYVLDDDGEISKVKRG